MFIRRKTLNAIFVQLDRQQRKLERYSEKLGKLHNKGEEDRQAVAALRKTVGSKRSTNYGLSLLASMYSYDVFPNSAQKAEPFTLVEKVDAIMEHLGLQEEVTAETKLVKVPKKKASK